VVDFEHLGLLDSRDAVRSRIEPRAQDDDLVEPFAQAGFEEVIDVPLPGSNEFYRPHPRSEESVVNAGINHQLAKENRYRVYQCAGDWIIANPFVRRS
jgi:hypothetical protein